MALLRIIAQRVGLVDQQGRIGTDWFTFFENMVRAINASRVTSSGTAYSLTGTATETTAATINVISGNTGTFRLTLCTSCTSNANVKTVRVKIGSTTVQTITLDSTTASQSMGIQTVGRGASSQFTFPSLVLNCTASGGVASTENLSANNTLVVTLQLGTITDTITLESWALEVEQI